MEPTDSFEVPVDSVCERQPATAVLQMSGMTCAACVNSIEMALGRISGVEKATVTLLPSQRATVAFDAVKVDPDRLKQAIEDAGYDVLDVETHREGDRKDGSTSTRLKVTLDSDASESAVDTFAAACVSLKALDGVMDATVEASNARGGGKETNVALLRITHDPSLTGIRTLISRVEQTAKGLHAEPAGPPPTSDSNRKDVYLLLLGGFITLIVFLIAMVGMMILPPDNAFRMSLEKTVGGIQIGVIVVWILATIMEFGVGWKFWAGAWNSVYKAHAANMDVLVVLGTGAAYFYSVYTATRDAIMYQQSLSDPHSTHSQTTMAAHDSFFEASVFIIFFVLLGKYFQKLATQRTGAAIEKLMGLQPDTATLVTFDPPSEQDIKVVLLEVGDVLKVVSGASVPADGVVVRGQTHVDESLLTGEPLPVSKGPGDPVHAGTVNTGSLIYLRATRVGSETTVSKIASMISSAQSSRAEIQATVDTLSRYFVPIVMVISVVTFIIWMVVPLDPSVDRTRLAIEFAISVLVIACPCGLGLAVPTAIMVGTGVAARYGILVAGGGAAFERAHQVGVWGFDKTGTLSEGKPSVVAMESWWIGKEEVWRLAGEVEGGSGHPLARAVVERAKIEVGTADVEDVKDKISEPASVDTPSVDSRETAIALSTLQTGFVLDGKYRVSTISETPGRGLIATLSLALPDDSLPPTLTCVAGNQAWMEENGCQLPESGKELIESWRSQARTLVFLGLVERASVIAAFAIADKIRPDAKELVGYLTANGKEVYMLTGDHSGSAVAVGQELGIPEERIVSGVKPEDKVEMVRRMQEGSVGDADNKGEGQQRMVAFVGDGVNDSVALAKADLSIAMGSGSDVAISSAAIVLMNSHLSAIIILLDLSAATFRRIWLNLFWAFLYNVVGIPVAAGAFYPLGVRLTPWMAAVAMAASSLSVVLSSLLLKLYRPPRTSSA